MLDDSESPERQKGEIKGEWGGGYDSYSAKEGDAEKCEGLSTHF